LTDRAEIEEGTWKTEHVALDREFGSFATIRATQLGNVIASYNQYAAKRNVALVCRGKATGRHRCAHRRRGRGPDGPQGRGGHLRGGRAAGDGQVVPARKGRGPKPKWHGLEVVSVAVSAKDASITTLMVAVEPCDVALIPALAIGQWRPVIVSNP
jgi:hypothetical protein